MAGLCLDSGILTFLLKVRADQTVIALTGTAASTVGKAGVRVASRFGDVGSLVCACLCLFVLVCACFPCSFPVLFFSRALAPTNAFTHKNLRVIVRNFVFRFWIAESRRCSRCFSRKSF